MNVKKMTYAALLIALGYILHQLVPGVPFLGGMKMDFLLVMMFLSLLLMDTYKEAVAVSLVCGIITAMTTTFPGGQIANLVDKAITGTLLFSVHKNFSHLMKPKNEILLGTLFGTLISGFIFLAVGLYVSGAPISFSALYMGIVLPTSVLNTGAAVLLHKAMSMSGVQKTISS